MDNVYPLFFYIEIFEFVCILVCVSINSITDKPIKLFLKNRRAELFHQAK